MHLRGLGLLTCFTATWELLRSTASRPTATPRETSPRSGRRASSSCSCSRARGTKRARGLTAPESAGGSVAGPNPFSPLRALSLKGYEFDGLVEGVPMLVAPALGRERSAGLYSSKRVPTRCTESS